MADIIELIPGAAAVRKEMESLRELEATLSGNEAKHLQAIIVALDAALHDVLKGKRSDADQP